MLDFFRSFLPAIHYFYNSAPADADDSFYSYSYSKPESSAYSRLDVGFYVYILTQLTPFLVLLGLPAFALLARTHWATLVRFVQMVLESLFGGLFWGGWSGSGSGHRDGERSAEEKRKRRKEKKDGKDEAGRGRRSQSVSDRESELEEEDDLDLHYPGLVNISGTYCFLNSVLQATASLAYLQPYIDAVHARAVDLDVPTPVIDTLQETLQALNTPKSSRSSLRPVPIINALSTPVPGSQGRSKLFASREHQDAQELFQLLSECIKSEAQAVDAEAQRDRGLGAFTSTSSPNSSSSSLFLRNSEIFHTGGGGEAGAELTSQGVFDGLTANRRSCVACGYTEAVMHFAFATWSLALPSVGSAFGTPSACTLQECLSDYTRLELLTDCICRRCSMRATHTRLKEEAEKLAEATKPGGPASGSQYKKKKAREARRLEKLVGLAIEEGRIEEDLSAKGVKMERVISPASTKQAMIARPPKVLVLHLNRSLHFSTFSSPARNPIRVRFPEILDLTPYTTSGQLSTAPSAPISTPPPPFPLAGMIPRSTTPTQGMFDHPRVLYRLSAVVAHYGAHSFGHYVCFRRKPRFSKRRKEARAYPTVPQMPCAYGCDCQLCATYGPVRDVDPFVSSASGSPSGSSLLSMSNSQSQPQPHNQNETQTYRPPAPGRGWLRISDDSVEEVGLDRVLSEGSGAFLLFYERVHNGATGWFGGRSFTPVLGSSSVVGMMNSSIGVGVSASPDANMLAHANTNTNMNLNRSISSTRSQPIGIGVGVGGGGVGVGSVYQHLKERSTPRSSEETVRPADVVSSGSTTSLSLLSSKGEDGIDGMTSSSVSSSLSSSLSGSGSGSGIVRPRVVRRTTASRRERSKGKDKEKERGKDKRQLERQQEVEVEVQAEEGTETSPCSKEKGKEKAKDEGEDRDGTAKNKNESVKPDSARTAEGQREDIGIPNGSANPTAPAPSLPLPNGTIVVGNDDVAEEMVVREGPEIDLLSESIVKVDLPSPPRSRGPSPSPSPSPSRTNSKAPQLPPPSPLSTSASSTTISTSESLTSSTPPTAPPSSAASPSPPPSPTSPTSPSSPISPVSPISPSRKRKAGKNKSRIARANNSRLSSPSSSASSTSVNVNVNGPGKVGRPGAAVGLRA